MDSSDRKVVRRYRLYSGVSGMAPPIPMALIWSEECDGSLQFHERPIVVIQFCVKSTYVLYEDTPESDQPLLGTPEGLVAAGYSFVSQSDCRDLLVLADGGLLMSVHQFTNSERTGGYEFPWTVVFYPNDDRDAVRCAAYRELLDEHSVVSAIGENEED